jgi:folate-binding protein YgfZ
MPEPKIALLPDRGVVAVSGPDAEKLIQGLLTCDLDALTPETSRLAALLTPQGKILFEMLIVRAADGTLLLETMRQQAPALVQRLQLYKLRANVDICDASADFTIAAAWGDPAIEGGALVCRDTRNPALGSRILASMATDRALGHHNAAAASAPQYHAHRIALGVPEGGRDFEFGDTFPHEANYDLTGGVSFDKGCFVGQEVVARMQHKTLVRKRVVPVEGTGSLPQDHPQVTAGSAVIGRLGSTAGNRGLALLRLDRAIEAIAKGDPIEVTGMQLTINAAALHRYRASAAEVNKAP